MTDVQITLVTLDALVMLALLLVPAFTYRRENRRISD